VTAIGFISIEALALAIAKRAMESYEVRRPVRRPASRVPFALRTDAIGRIIQS
jgi:hypothetical protein